MKIITVLFILLITICEGKSDLEKNIPFLKIAGIGSTYGHFCQEMMTIEPNLKEGALKLSRKQTSDNQDVFSLRFYPEKIFSDDSKKNLAKRISIKINTLLHFEVDFYTLFFKENDKDILILYEIEPHFTNLNVSKIQDDLDNLDKSKLNSVFDIRRGKKVFSKILPYKEANTKTEIEIFKNRTKAHYGHHTWDVRFKILSNTKITGYKYTEFRRNDTPLSLSLNDGFYDLNLGDSLSLIINNLCSHISQDTKELALHLSRDDYLNYENSIWKLTLYTEKFNQYKKILGYRVKRFILIFYKNKLSRITFVIHDNDLLIKISEDALESTPSSRFSYDDKKHFRLASLPKLLYEEVNKNGNYIDFYLQKIKDKNHYLKHYPSPNKMGYDTYYSLEKDSLSTIGIDSLSRKEKRSKNKTLNEDTTSIWYYLKEGKNIILFYYNIGYEYEYDPENNNTESIIANVNSLFYIERVGFLEEIKKGELKK